VRKASTFAALLPTLHTVIETCWMKGVNMERLLAAPLLAAGVFLGFPASAHHQASEASELSMLPVASVVIGVGAAASAVVAVPVALSVAGAELAVRSVEASAHGTICVLERVSDGARVTVELAGRGAAHASLGVGRVVTVVATGAGVVLSAAGEAIAFVPDAIGQALMYNERLTF
jgi:hypothetical protein